FDSECAARLLGGSTSCSTKGARRDRAVRTAQSKVQAQETLDAEGILRCPGAREISRSIQVHLRPQPMGPNGVVLFHAHAKSRNLEREKIPRDNLQSYVRSGLSATGGGRRGSVRQCRSHRKVRKSGR